MCDPHDQYHHLVVKDRVNDHIVLAGVHPAKFRVAFELT
jgi:hypothetical protein